MDIKDLLQTMGVILALVGAAVALLKSIKMAPVERASTDASASKEFAEAAKIAAEQVTSALLRIEKLETRSAEMSDEVEALQGTLEQRDKCIDTLNAELRRRDQLISEWANGIRILVGQLEGAKLTPLWKPDSFEPRLRV